jgi:hypothetical protein
MKRSKDKVAMVGLEDSVGVIGGDGVVRSTMALGGLISHRACLGAYKSPLINLRACTGVDLVDPTEFFKPPMNHGDLMDLFSHSSKSRAKQIPESAWGDVFPTPQKQTLAARGFSGTLKKFAADLWLNGHLSYRNVLVTSSSIFKIKHHDVKDFEYLHWSDAQASKLDALRAHSISSTNAAGIRWPRGQLKVEYTSHAITAYAEDIENENALLYITQPSVSWNLKPQNVFPDGNSLFYALSAQENGYDVVDKSTGQAPQAFDLRLKYASNKPRKNHSRRF